MKKLNKFQTTLLKLATRYINKHQAIEITKNTKLLLHDNTYYIVEYECRSAINEVDSLVLKAHSPTMSLI